MLTNGSLWVLHTYADPGRALEMAVLVVSNAIATLVRVQSLR